jgi:hypothetical protein
LQPLRLRWLGFGSPRCWPNRESAITSNDDTAIALIQSTNTSEDAIMRILRYDILLYGTSLAGLKPLLSIVRGLYPDANATTQYRRTSHAAA